MGKVPLIVNGQTPSCPEINGADLQSHKSYFTSAEKRQVIWFSTKLRQGKLSTPILVMGESQSSNRLRFKMWVRGFAMI